MTTNLVPHHIFIRHEYEWQALREAAERLEKTERREAPPLPFVHGVRTNPPGQDAASSISFE